MKEWYIAEGKVSNRKDNFGKTFHINKDGFRETINSIVSYINKQKGKIICINDTELTGKEYEDGVKKIIDALEHIMPEKSTFEK